MVDELLDEATRERRLNKLLMEYRHVATKAVKIVTRTHAQKDIHSLYSEAMLALWRGLTTYDNQVGIPLESYLNVCVFRACRTFALTDYFSKRKLKPRQFYVADDGWDSCQAVPHTSRDFLEKHRLAREVVLLAVSKLQPKQAEVVRLIYLEGWRWNAVEKHLGISHAAIGLRLKRAYRAIRVMCLQKPLRQMIENALGIDAIKILQNLQRADHSVEEIA